jgi:hypothetical protein
MTVHVNDLQTDVTVERESEEPPAEPMANWEVNHQHRVQHQRLERDACRLEAEGFSD